VGEQRGRKGRKGKEKRQGRGGRIGDRISKPRPSASTIVTTNSLIPFPFHGGSLYQEKEGGGEGERKKEGEESRKRSCDDASCGASSREKEGGKKEEGGKERKGKKEGRETRKT